MQFARYNTEDVVSILENLKITLLDQGINGGSEAFDNEISRIKQIDIDKEIKRKEALKQWIHNAENMTEAEWHAWVTTPQEES